MISLKKFRTAEEVYNDRLLEKMPITINDQLKGMQIYASQMNEDEYLKIFETIMEPEDGQ